MLCCLFRWSFQLYTLVKAARDTARSADVILSFLLSSKQRFFFSHCAHRLNKSINQWRTEHYIGISSVGNDVPPLRPHLLSHHTTDPTHSLRKDTKRGVQVFSLMSRLIKFNLHNCWTQLKLWRCSLSSLPAKLTGFEGKWTETRSRRRRRRRCRLSEDGTTDDSAVPFVTQSERNGESYKTGPHRQTINPTIFHVRGKKYLKMRVDAAVYIADLSKSKQIKKHHVRVCLRQYGK